jgi:hypothetical protein
MNFEACKALVGHIDLTDEQAKKVCQAMKEPSSSQQYEVWMIAQRNFSNMRKMTPYMLKLLGVYS